MDWAWPKNPGPQRGTCSENPGPQKGSSKKKPGAKGLSARYNVY